MSSVSKIKPGLDDGGRQACHSIERKRKAYIKRMSTLRKAIILALNEGQPRLAALLETDLQSLTVGETCIDRAIMIVDWDGLSRFYEHIISSLSRLTSGGLGARSGALNADTQQASSTFLMDLNLPVHVAPMSFLVSLEPNEPVMLYAQSPVPPVPLSLSDGLQGKHNRQERSLAGLGQDWKAWR